MKICQNKGNPDRDDDQGSNGYTALCHNHVNQVGTKPELTKYEEDATDEYQQLLCYQCGGNQINKMLVCENEKDGKERNDKYGKNGYSVLCPNCVEFVGIPSCKKAVYK